MWNNYSDAIIFIAVITIYWFLTKVIVAVKAKAFNDGYKRGRASINVREIIK
jgi:hypothetical protein